MYTCLNPIARVSDLGARPLVKNEKKETAHEKENYKNISRSPQPTYYQVKPNKATPPAKNTVTVVKIVCLDQPSVLEPMELNVRREVSAGRGDLGDVAEPVAEAVIIGSVGGFWSDVAVGTAG
jgi:hypothetical protein